MRVPIVLVLLVAGCGQVAVAQPGPADDFFCGTEPMTLDIMKTGRPATDLSVAGADTLRRRNVDLQGVALKDWRITADDAEHVGLVRELREPTPDEDPEAFVPHASTFAYVSVFTSDPSNNYGKDCPLRRRPVGIGPAYFPEDTLLAPQARIAASATRIPLLVHETGCANGQPATGRVVVHRLEPTPTQVKIIVGITPIPGGALCPGNPPTPYTLTLPEPLGHRPLVDVAYYPDRVVVPAPS